MVTRKTIVVCPLLFSKVYNALNAGEKTVNLVGHSGGVQVVMGASSYLGDIKIAVDHLVGIQGPTLGRYNNANSITLMGNAGIGSGFDAVSGLGRLGAPLVFGKNLQTDFTVQIPKGMESHISPDPKTPIGQFWIRKVNDALAR